MPCVDDVYGFMRGKPQQDKVEKLTRIACEALKACEVAGVVFDGFSSELQYWWLDHKGKDAQRIAAERPAQEREALRKSALEKLTPEERKSLGIP